MFEKRREMETIERVKEVVHPYISNSGKMETFTNLRKDLDLDSFDLIEIFMDLEDEFAITILDEAVEAIMTLQDLVDVVNNSPSS